MNKILEQFNLLNIPEQIYLINIILEGIKSARELYLDKIGEEDFNKLTEIDPSKTKKYLNWICKQYIDGVNIDKLEDIIKDFDYKANKKGLKSTDINYYKNIDELEQAIKETAVSTEIDKTIKRRSDAEIVLDNKDYLIVSPKTFEASQYYGNATHWCTSLQKSYFNDYTKRDLSKLYYILDKSKQFYWDIDCEEKNYNDKENQICIYSKVAVLSLLDSGEYFETMETYDNFKFYDKNDNEIGDLPGDMSDIDIDLFIPQHMNMNTKEGIEYWLDKMEIENYHINKDLTIDVNGDVDIDKEIETLPVKFGIIKGDVSYNGRYYTNIAKKIYGDLFFTNDEFIDTEEEDILKEVDFSFVLGKLYTGFENIDNYWNTKEKVMPPKEKIEYQLYKLNIKDYIINEDLTIDVKGDVIFDSSSGYNEIPFQFGEVKGNFIWRDAKLYSLKGAPNECFNFACINSKLTSLKYAPKKCINFLCYDNNLTSLEYASKGCVHILFDCHNNNLTTLKYHPAECEDFICNNNPNLTKEYLSNFDFSFVTDSLITDYSDINIKWGLNKYLDTKEGIANWLDKKRIWHYTINDDLTVDVNGNVRLIFKDLEIIPIKFGIVKGWFEVDNNPNLISLENHPIECERFHCIDTPKLTYKYLKNFDFSFVKEYLWTDYSDINDKWNKK